jgi:hypothetical protein
MIKENKVSKYLLYAIGEIVLVVIGILIALQINNWNEGRKIDSREVSAMKEMVENLKYDLVRCQRNIEINAEVIVGLDSLRACISDAIEGKERTADIYYYSLKYGVDFSQAVINDNTYEEMVNSGLIKEIENKELVQKISDYYERISINVEGSPPLTAHANMRNIQKRFISYEGLDAFIRSFDHLNETTFSPDFDYKKILAMENLDLLQPMDLSLSDYYNEIAHFEIDLKAYMFYMSWTADNAIKLIEKIEKEYHLTTAHP